MFWKYTFCCLVVIYISNAVIFSKEKILQRGPSERLQYAIFKNDLFHALDGTRIEVGYVETAKHCLVNCVKSLQCFSANIGVHLGKNGQVLCELLSSDKYSSAKSYHMNASFHHYRISVSLFFHYLSFYYHHFILFFVLFIHPTLLLGVCGCEEKSYHCLI